MKKAKRYVAFFLMMILVFSQNLSYAAEEPLIPVENNQDLTDEEISSEPADVSPEPEENESAISDIPETDAEDIPAAVSEPAEQDESYITRNEWVETLDSLLDLSEEEILTSCEWESLADPDAYADRGFVAYVTCRAMKLRVPADEDIDALNIIPSESLEISLEDTETEEETEEEAAEESSSTPRECDCISLDRDWFQAEEGPEGLVFDETLPVTTEEAEVIQEDIELIQSLDETEEGTDEIIYLNDENSEFVPSEELQALSSLVHGDDETNLYRDYYKYFDYPEAGNWGYQLFMFEYRDGKLTINSDYFELSLSNMQIPHNFSSTSSYLGLKADYNLKIKQGATFNPPFELGEVKIYEVGTIRLTLNVEAELSVEVGGNLEIGARTLINDGKTTYQIVNEFNFGADGGDKISLDSVPKTARLDGILKLFAGLDALIVRGGFYGEVVIRNEYKTQVFPAGDNKTDTCQDLSIYAFLRAGVEAVYIRPDRKEDQLISNDVSPVSEENPLGITRFHWENGEYCGNWCSHGMEPPEVSVDKLLVACPDDPFESGIIVTDVELPYDITVEKLIIAEGGSIKTHEHTLTINGDLIIDGGSLDVHFGEIIVNGNLIVTHGYIENFGTITVNGDSYFGGITKDNEYATSSDISMYVEAFGCGTWNTNGLLVTKVDPEMPFLNGNHLNLGGDWISDSIRVRGVVEQHGHAVEINGTLVNDAEWNVDSGSLSVEENLTIAGNYLEIGSGNAYIQGDLIAGNRILQEDGTLTYEGTGGILRLGTDNAAGGSLCAGNLITTSEMTLKSGSLYLKGGLYQYGGSDGWGGYALTTDPDCAVRFLSAKDPETGEYLETKHPVHLESYSSNLRNVKTDPRSILVVDEWIGADQLGSDLTIQSEGGRIDHLNQNGYTVTIHGDVGLIDNWNLEGGQALLKGSLNHMKGEITPGGGNLHITGDYICGEEDSDIGNWRGPTLIMTDPEDLVDIDGDYVINNRGKADLQEGVLRLAGDLRETGQADDSHTDFDIPSYKNHLTILDGTEPQSIQFVHESCGFNRLHLTQSMSRYTFSRPRVWYHLTVEDELAAEYADLVKVTGYNLSVFDDSTIGFNYYIEVPEVLFDKGLTAEVSVAEDTDSGTGSVLQLTEENATKLYNPDDIEWWAKTDEDRAAVYSTATYKISIKVPAAQMTCPYTLKVGNADMEPINIASTVQEYCQTLLQDTSGEYDKYREVIRTMLNYGASAQNYFDVKTESLANSVLAEEDRSFDIITKNKIYTGWLQIMNPITVDEEEMVSYYGTSLILDSGLTIRHYFSISDNADPALVSVSSYADISDIQWKGNLFYVDVQNVPRNQVDQDKSVTINYGDQKGVVRYSALHYLYKLYDNGIENPELVDLVSALYAFGKAKVA